MALETAFDLLKARGQIRAICPSGARLKMRARLITAMRDAVYHMKGWGQSAGSVKVTADDAVVIRLFAHEALPAGYSVEGKLVRRT